MGIIINGKEPKEIYLGNKLVTEVYAGSNKVWPTVIPEQWITLTDTAVNLRTPYYTSTASGPTGPYFALTDFPNITADTIKKIRLTLTPAGNFNYKSNATYISPTNYERGNWQSNIKTIVEFYPSSNLNKPNINNGVSPLIVLYPNGNTIVVYGLSFKYTISGNFFYLLQYSYTTSNTSDSRTLFTINKLEVLI